MWYAVETVFIDGVHFGSKCLFVDGDTSPVGHCYSNDIEPGNRCEKHFDDRIEIHTDWFESEQLAKDFASGKITYIHYYDTYFKKSINSTLSHFRERKIVDVDNDTPPYRGVYEFKPINYHPVWA